MIPIKVYYTLVTVNNWKSILEEQLTKIVHAGMAHQITSINVGINLVTEKIELPFNEKFNFNILYSTEENPYETLTYKAFIQDCQKNSTPHNILYMHSKGIGGNPFAKSWRDYMEYFCIENWKNCVSGLRTDYDTCGVDLNDVSEYNEKNGYYSGNFWWASSEYLKTLDTSILDSYVERYGHYAQEQFTCYNWNARHKCLHTSHRNFYGSEYPESSYRVF